MFTIYFFSDIFLILYIVFVFNLEKLREGLPSRFVSCRYVIMFSISGSMFEI